MAFPGTGALAMWWDMEPAQRAEFEHWHSHEHFPERMAIPGFLRGSRWLDAGGGKGVFVLYEVESHDVLASAPYLASLNAPTPWSTKMMPHHHNMVRSQCTVLETAGGAVARHAATLRLSPAEGKDVLLRSALGGLLKGLPQRAGLTGAHLLQHRAPQIAVTTEQRIRGNADAVADWVLVVMGYDPAALKEVQQAELADEALVMVGASRRVVRGTYTLSYSANRSDVL